jgi:hypothetical protein
MQFRKRYILSLNDFLWYNRFSRRRTLTLMPGMFLALALVLFCVLLLMGGNAWLLAIAVPLALALSGLILGANVLMLDKQARRQYQTSPALQAEFELVMDKDGVRESGAGGSSRAAWTQVIYAVESRRAFYVHVAPYRAFVIPKALLDAREDADIRRLLFDNLAGRRCRVRDMGQSGKGTP